MLRPVRIVEPAGELLTLEEAKSLLEIHFTDHDDLIRALIVDSIDYLDGYNGILGRCIIDQTWQQKFGFWQHQISLPFPDCSSVEVRYFDATGTEQTVDEAAYNLLETSGSSCLLFKNSFSEPELETENPAPITVEMVAGYGDAGSVPGNVRRSVSLLVGHLYENREATGIAKDQIALGFRSLMSSARTAIL